MTGTTFKTTAIALQNRRLVTVSRKGGVWKAAATDAGRYFVANGSYPDGHWTAPAKGQVGALPPKPPGPVPKRERPVSGLRPVDHMLADIAAAGGTLQVTDGEGYYEGLVASATRYGKVPDGKVLQIVSGRRWGEKTLRLVDQPAWMTLELAPIPVGDRLLKPHPAVVTLRADRDHRLRFKRPIRQRALLILDALAKAATERGYTVTSPPWDRQQRNAPADLLIDIHGHPHALHVAEDTDKVPHEATAQELRNHERWHSRIPKYDKVPSGRLIVTINGGIPVRQSAFADTKTINLGDRLPVLLQELELRAANSEQRRLQAEQEAAERRHRWEQIRDDAVVALREHHRAALLTEQADQWRQARALTEYVDAMETHIASLDGEEKTNADEWLTWARAHLATCDPLSRPLAIPPDPQVTPEALKPFMRGHSPYGPDHRVGW